MSPRLRVFLALVTCLAATRACVALVDRPPAPPPALVDLDPAQVTRIVLARGDASLTLSRDATSPTGWSVVDAEGRAAAARPGLDALLARVRAWRCDRPAGGGPERHAEWGVSEQAARGLRLEGADRVVADLLVGRIAGIELADAVTQGGALDTRRLGLFVRRRGEEATWVVSEFLTRELEPTATAWALPPLYGVAAPEVTRLAVGGVVLVFSPDQPPRLEGGGPVEPGRARALLLASLGLTPRALAPAPASAEGALQVELTTRDGAVRSCRLWLSAAGAVAEVPGGFVELEPRSVERLRTALTDLAPR